MIQYRDRAAHETEYAFAKILASDKHINTPLYDQWSPFFIYLYDRSIEKMAEDLATAYKACI